MAKDTSEKPKPAYAPYRTLSSFLGALDSAQPPRHIDPTMMPTFSGAMKSRLMTSLEFLGFVRASGEVTDRLRDYLRVRNQQDQRKAALKRVIKTCYSPIIGDLDVATISPKKLQEAFKAVGCEGTTSEDAIRFYIKLCQDAGIQVSSFVLARQQRSLRRKNGKGAIENPPGEDGSLKQGRKPPGGKEHEAPPVGTIDFPMHFKGRPSGLIRLPERLVAEDLKVIELTISLVKIYAKQTEGNNG
jgi:Family of unknown function (DUF5343)